MKIADLVFSTAATAAFCLCPGRRHVPQHSSGAGRSPGESCELEVEQLEVVQLEIGWVGWAFTLFLSPSVLRHLSQASEDVLCEEGEVEAAMESRLALASALARQWFGVLLMARTPQDQ